MLYLNITPNVEIISVIVWIRACVLNWANTFACFKCLNSIKWTNAFAPNGFIKKEKP